MAINGFLERRERQLQQRMRDRAELERQYDTKVYRRLKYHTPREIEETEEERV